MSLYLPSRRPLALGTGVGVLLRDDFERADTSAGDLGTPPIGSAWVLKAPYVASYPLPASSYGQIASGAFVVPGGQTVYAFTTVVRTPKVFEVEWSWVDDSVGTQFTTLAVIVSSSANGIDTMLHITVTNGVCNIQKRLSGGSFITMNTGSTSISPGLALSNTVHRLRLDISGDTARVRIDDTRYDVTVTDAAISDVVGPVLAVEHYSASTDVRWPMQIHRVEARG